MNPSPVPTALTEQEIDQWKRDNADMIAIQEKTMRPNVMVDYSALQGLKREARLHATITELQEKVRQLEAENKETREHLGSVLVVARLKWGNLDPDANRVMCKAEGALGRQSCPGPLPDGKYHHGGVFKEPA